MTTIRDRALATLERRAEVARTSEMFTFLNNLRALAKDERGVTALEYGLIAGLMATALIGVIGSLTGALSTKFTAIATAINP